RGPRNANSPRLSARNRNGIHISSSSEKSGQSNTVKISEVHQEFRKLTKQTRVAKVSGATMLRTKLKKCQPRLWPLTNFQPMRRIASSCWNTIALALAFSHQVHVPAQLLARQDLVVCCFDD